MFRFENPSYMWLLVLIPLSVLLYLYTSNRQKKRLSRFSNPHLIPLLAPALSVKRRFWKFILAEVVLILLVLILARPQIGSKIATNSQREGVETIIAMDISNSMLATDVSPSRLERSKLIVENVMNKFRNNKIGLIVFAGDAFVQLPITSDYVSGKMFLDNINPSLIGTQGTDIGKAINLATHSFTPNSKTGKAIILITDGEDNEGGAEEAAKNASSKGIKLIMLGVGSTEGGLIPMPDGSVLKDDKGEVVRTKLNEQMCKDIASAGKGTYIHVDNALEVDAMLEKELSSLQKGEIRNVVYSEFDEQFQSLAIIIVILLIIDSLIIDRKRI